MIDIKALRENPDLYKENIKKKNQDHKLILVDHVLEYDKELKQFIKDSETLRARRNVLSEEINKLKKAGQDASVVLQEVKEIPNKIKAIEEKSAHVEEKLRAALIQIPNIMNSAVPLGKSDEENVQLKTFGTPKTFSFEVKNISTCLAE